MSLKWLKLKIHTSDLRTIGNRICLCVSVTCSVYSHGGRIEKSQFLFELNLSYKKKEKKKKAHSAIERWANKLAHFLSWNRVQRMWKDWALKVTAAACLCIHVRAHACGAVQEASWPSRCWSLSRECWQSVPIDFTADQTTKWTRTGTAAVGQSSLARQCCYSNHTDITAHLMLPCTHIFHPLLSSTVPSLTGKAWFKIGFKYMWRVKSI